MENNNMLSSYIQKLNHPLIEIRERSLQVLVAKLHLGWEFEDELAGTRQLLESLLSWFQHTKPTLQRQALDLLLTTIKTKAGTYIIREFGVEDIMRTLNKLKDKIDYDAKEVYMDIMDSMRFLNTVASEEDIRVPRLPLHEINSSGSEGGSSSGYYNLGSNLKSSKETSISNDHYDFDLNYNKGEDGIKVLLFPWVDLCSSDVKTIILVEDALRLLKSIRRCCRFIRDVFLCDFPPEIFLNRPKIVQTLLSIVDGTHDGRPGEALHVLLCITNTLRKRLLQLSSLDLIHESIKFTEGSVNVSDDINVELEKLSGDSDMKSLRRDDELIALKQLPAPQYTVDTLQTVLSNMMRNVVLNDSVDKSYVLNLKELNTCLQLVESLLELLIDCVSEKFWSADHSTKTHRDLSHKCCMVMRLMGDLIIKYRKSFFDDTNRTHHRMAWLRLVFCAEKLMNWSKESALPPSTIVMALQTAQLDPAVELFYPQLSTNIATVLENTKTSVDHEYKSKYRELCKIFESMKDTVQFMKDTSFRKNKRVINCIKNIIPAMEMLLSEQLLNDVADVLLKNIEDFDLNENDWNIIRNIALHLMAHNAEWIRVTFYKRLADMVKSIFIDNESRQLHSEKRLHLLCDVGILTEICCHGLSSSVKEVEEYASSIILYLLRGRLILSEKCWWRLLACLLPILPLLHVYAAHETLLGQAICKSLELDIAECMGVSTADVMSGLVRLMFVRCVAVQLDASHSLCRLLDDDRYLPPRESLRADVLLNALRRIEPQDFNIDFSSSPSRTAQTTGLMQILDVLKQDIVLDEHGTDVRCNMMRPALEPSLRRSTLQQLAVMMRQQDLHDAFLQGDGLTVVMATLRMSLLVDDYLAFPECAISCVSILNSICFASRHTLVKIPDLPSLLIRVILVFPANDSAVVMCAQVLSLVAWAGFVLQEIDSSHRRVPALPLNVTERTSLPFKVNSYWNTSPNAEHSYIEWVLDGEEYRAAVRVRWWWLYSGGARVLLDAAPAPAPLALQPSARDLLALRAAHPRYCVAKALLALENATSHTQVNDALGMLESYTCLMHVSCVSWEELSALPWQHTRRYLSAPPASARDMALLVSLLQFIIAYMDTVPKDGTLLSWVKSSFIGNDVSIISLLSRDQFYPQQTAQEDIEVTQLHIHIVKVLLRCIVLSDSDDCDSSRMESLVKILLACLDKVDLKNFHMLGYLNELMRCLRYALNSDFCKLSENTLIQCMRCVTRIISGCATGSARKGEACRLNGMLSLLALLRQAHEEAIPVQRWSEAWSGDVLRALCVRAGGRRACAAGALHVLAALAHHAHMLPQLTQALEESSLSGYAARIFSSSGEAGVVRAAAAALLAVVAARSDPSHVVQCEVLEQLADNNFIECCLDIFVDFCNIKEYKHTFEGNLCLSVLERRGELEVRAQKCSDVRVSPGAARRARPPPTASLLAAAADVLHNVSAFARLPVTNWNERGLYRLLFRCASWSRGSLEEERCVRASVCRALFAATTHKCVRTSLASTKDCLHSLVLTLKPFAEEVSSSQICACTQTLLLVGSLLSERAAADTVWALLRETTAPPMLHLLLQCLQIDETELQEAAMYCLTQLLNSTKSKKHVDNTKDESWIQLYDNVKYCPVNDYENTARDPRECQPEYLAEEICKTLINLYKKSSSNMKNFQASEDELWVAVCGSACGAWGASVRSRAWGAHAQAPRVLLSSLHGLRDHLAMHGKPAQLIANADYDPILRTLYWVLTLIDCSMVDCLPAKESYVDGGIAASLIKLWPWCMLTEQLRKTVLHLVYTFTNDCPKAWSAMCSCVCGRSVAGETCALAARVAAHPQRTHTHALLPLALAALTHCMPHHHCRAIIIKSEAIAAAYRACVRGRRGGAAWGACARAVEAMARHADGAGAALALLQARGAAGAALLPALAHAAHHHRALFLQSPDLLELLCGSLLMGDTSEVVSAARAVWALAANNHKAKLMLRSAGVVSAVESALQKLRRDVTDASSQRALQLLTYTNTLLQTA